jgi:hypothetical protein
MTWVKMEIITRFKTKYRERVIKHFIEIMQHLLEMKNFNSVCIIAGVLTSAPISNLKRSWDHLKKETSEIERLYTAARIDIKKYPISFPCIPPFQELIESISNQAPVMTNGKIHWLRLRNIANVMVIIRTYFFKYNFSSLHLVESFIKQRLDINNIPPSDIEKVLQLASNCELSGAIPSSTDLASLDKIIKKYSP